MAQLTCDPIVHEDFEGEIPGESSGGSSGGVGGFNKYTLGLGVLVAAGVVLTL